MRQESAALYPVPAAIVLGAMPSLTPRAEMVVRILSARGGSLISTDRLAQRTGLDNRHALNRELADCGLPPPARLAHWIEAVSFILHWKAGGTAVASRELSVGRDPAVIYRRIRRLTGASWNEVQQRGLAWLLMELASECHALSPRVTDGQARSGAECGGRRLHVPGLVTSEENCTVSPVTIADAWGRGEGEPSGRTGAGITRSQDRRMR